MRAIIRAGQQVRCENRVAVIGSVSTVGRTALLGLRVAMETLQLDEYRQEKYMASLLPVQPRETGLISMTEILAEALRDTDQTAVVIDGNDILGQEGELRAAMESLGVRVFGSMRDGVVWVNSLHGKA